MTRRNLTATTGLSRISPLDPSRVETIEKAGARILPLDPIGAAVFGIDLSSGG